MKTNTATTAQTPHDLLNDLHTLVGEAEKMIGESVSEHTEDTMTALRARFDATQSRLTELYSGARTKVIAGAKYTDDTIRANPYQSLAIAAGVGLLVGVLVGRRNK